MLENKYKLLDKMFEHYKKEAFLNSIFFMYQEECEMKVQLEREDENLTEDDRWYDDIDVDLRCDTEMDREEMVIVLVEDLERPKEEVKQEFLNSFKVQIKNESTKKQKVFLKAAELYINAVLNDSKGYYEANIIDIWDKLDE